MTNALKGHLGMILKHRKLRSRDMSNMRLLSRRYFHSVQSKPFFRNKRRQTQSGVCQRD